MAEPCVVGLRKLQSLLGLALSPPTCKTKLCETTMPVCSNPCVRAFGLIVALCICAPAPSRAAEKPRLVVAVDGVQVLDVAVPSLAPSVVLGFTAATGGTGDTTPVLVEAAPAESVRVP